MTAAAAAGRPGVFLDRELRVLKVAEHVHPWKAIRSKGARAVLELRAGEVVRRRIKVGDVLEVATP